MQDLFNPDSVLVVGVSDEPHNMAAVIVNNLDRFGFEGDVFLAGRKGGELNGRKIYERIDTIDATIDLAVLLIPARFIPETLDECGERGIRYAIIESAGFSEYGEETHDLERAVKEVAQKWGMRLVGPNGLGIVNLENSFVVPFVPLNPALTKKGHVSISSQSGGVIVESTRLLFIENVGFNKMISMGNKLDLNEGDFVRYLASDPSTHTIGLYLENISDGRKLMNGAFSTDKPIIVLKANTNPYTHRIAQFHTSALAGDDQVVDGAFAQAGLLRVHSIQEMIKAFKIFSLPPMRGKKLGVICRSGGHAVLIADSVHRHGFELARFSESFFEMVAKMKVSGVIRMTNPLDLGDVYDIDFYVNIIEMALREKDVDGVVFHHAYVTDNDLEPTERLIREAERLAFQYDKPLVFCMLSEQKDWFSMKQVADFATFSDSDHALKSLKLSYDHSMNRVRFAAKQGTIPEVVKTFEGVERRSAKLLAPEEAFELLRAYHLPVAEYTVVRDVEEGVKAAATIGYPVAVKIADPHILHKTEAKGVRLSISSEEELKSVIEEMGGDEFLIQKMAETGREVIIGGKQDNEFGPVILFGLGGVFVEILKDTAIRVAPVDAEEATRMLEQIKGRHLLDDFRGHSEADKKALVQCIVHVSRLLYEHPEVRNLDINPMIVGNAGEGCIVVDAKIETVQDE